MSAAASSRSLPSPGSAFGTFLQKTGSSPPSSLASRPIPAPHVWRAAPVSVSFLQRRVEWENWKYLKSQKLVFARGQSLGAGFSRVTAVLPERRAR